MTVAVHPLSSHANLGDAYAAARDTGPAWVSIRGTRLELGELCDRRLLDPDYLDRLRAEMQQAKPYAHLVVSDWFNPDLLALVREEFDELPKDDWKTEFNRHARVERSRVDAPMGPASRLYFSMVHSGAFLNVLGYVSGVPDLLCDPHLHGGGLHETLAGGSFGIHADFDRHPCTALNNELVLITYLNKGWKPEWNGALELWDADKKACVRTIEPEFGRTVIMTHGARNFHGHSLPLSPPPGVTRRSIAAYFYANRFAREDRREAMLSKFLFSTSAERKKAFAKYMLPPFVVDAIKRLVRR